jgi:hypothetical protein
MTCTPDRATETPAPELLALLADLPARLRPDHGFEDRLVDAFDQELAAEAEHEAQLSGCRRHRVRLGLLLALSLYLGLRALAALALFDGGQNVAWEMLVDSPDYIYLPAAEAAAPVGNDGVMIAVHRLTALYLETGLWLLWLGVVASLVLGRLRQQMGLPRRDRLNQPATQVRPATARELVPPTAVPACSR